VYFFEEDTVPVAMATALGTDILKLSLPSNTEELEKVVKEAATEELGPV
jgi:DhnA family fructose-bisphosphate aldolase class Ia